MRFSFSSIFAALAVLSLLLAIWESGFTALLVGGPIVSLVLTIWVCRLTELPQAQKQDYNATKVQDELSLRNELGN